MGGGGAGVGEFSSPMSLLLLEDNNCDKLC